MEEGAEINTKADHLYLIGMKVVQFKNINMRNGAKPLGPKNNIWLHISVFGTCSHRCPAPPGSERTGAVLFFFPKQAANHWEDVCVSCLLPPAVWLAQHHCSVSLFKHLPGQIQQIWGYTNSTSLGWRTSARRLPNTTLSPSSLHFTQACFFCCCFF